MADSRLDELRRRLEKDPGSRLFAQLAEQLRKEGELEEAIGIARAGLEKHPTYPSARLTLGRALLDSGDATAARAELDAAVQGAPDNILASRVLGEALEALGELKAAVEQFRATLVMAPGDAQIEGRIKGIEEQLAKPAAPAEPSADVARQDHTKPMRAVSLESTPRAEQPPAPPPEEPSVPPLPPAAETGPDEEEEEGGLPPTIRIRMPGDPLAGGRAPLPPVPGAPETTGKEATPRSEPEREAARPDAGSAPAEPPPTPGGAGDATAHSEQAPTLPGSKAAEYAGAEELPPTVPPRAPKAPVPVAADEVATTSEAEPAEAAVVEEPLPPTVPPGLVTTPAGLDARAPAGEGSTGQAGLAGGVGAEVTRPPVPPEVADTTTPPVPPEPAESPESTRAPVPPEAAEPPPAPSEAVVGGDGPGEGGEPLSSATLAELYLEQGLLERAIEVYREVLEAEPANASARSRLEELEASLRASASESATSGAEADDERAAKRRVLERTIERLEALLTIVQRR